MAMITNINFRNQNIDVKYTDHGYEPDTNAHDIDWQFVDEEYNKLELTSEEQEDIYFQLFLIAQCDDND